MSDESLRTARIVSSVAATCISLACGTNYVYSAWAPQFADKLKLSSTESNLIGLSGNLGMYSMGIPIGILVDTKGPRPAVLIGALLLAAGYFPLHQAYDRGSGSLPLLCMFSFFTGLGSCGAFAAAVKTSALNWPYHRGTATAFPLAAFGLSAFFFSMFAQFLVPGDTGDFLMLLASGTFGLVAVSFFFMRVLPTNQHYSALPASELHGPSQATRLHKRKSEEGRHRIEGDLNEPGRSTPIARSTGAGEGGVAPRREAGEEAPEGTTPGTDETSSLILNPSGATPARLNEENSVKDCSHRIDIRGMRMLLQTEFWLLFALMGILTGIGLMTINNIGNDASALWRHYDDSATEEFIMKRQGMHVSILSVGSFTGRLLSGVGSDFLAKALKASRLWCLTLASLIFLAAQMSALSIENPHYLGLVSGLTGLAYGFLFGCFPSLVAEAFGIQGLSTNWGCMTLAPVLSGNVFNLFYGSIYDKHSIVKDGGERECTEGLECYRSAYVVTLVACIIGLAVSLFSIHHTKKTRQQEATARELDDRAA